MLWNGCMLFRTDVSKPLRSVPINICFLIHVRLPSTAHLPPVHFSRLLAEENVVFCCPPWKLHGMLLNVQQGRSNLTFGRYRSFSVSSFDDLYFNNSLSVSMLLLSSWGMAHLTFLTPVKGMALHATINPDWSPLTNIGFIGSNCWVPACTWTHLAHFQNDLWNLVIIDLGLVIKTIWAVIEHSPVSVNYCTKYLQIFALKCTISDQNGSSTPFSWSLWMADLLNSILIRFRALFLCLSQEQWLASQLAFYKMDFPLCMGRLAVKSPLLV